MRRSTSRAYFGALNGGRLQAVGCLTQGAMGPGTNVATWSKGVFEVSGGMLVGEEYCARCSDNGEALCLTTLVGFCNYYITSCSVNG